MCPQIDEEPRTGCAPGLGLTIVIVTALGVLASTIFSIVAGLT